MLAAMIRSLVPRWLKNYRRKINHQAALRRSWLTRQTSATDDHLDIYWNSGDQVNRKLLIGILVDLLKTELEQTPTGVLEYGSHVGINLKLLHDALGDQAIKYYAVEPNREAFTFMRSKLNFVDALNGEDEGFLDAKGFPSEPVGVSFVNSVFYCVAPRRAKAVLSKLCARSNTIVIGDGMDNVEGKQSEFAAEPPCYQHPYKKWLRQFGFNYHRLIDAPDPRPQLNGFLIARRTASGEVTSSAPTQRS
jgi:hypothetical protein